MMVWTDFVVWKLCSMVCSETEPTARHVDGMLNMLNVGGPDVLHDACRPPLRAELLPQFGILSFPCSLQQTKAKTWNIYLCQHRISKMLIGQKIGSSSHGGQEVI